MPQRRSGRTRITDPAALPDLPTIAESGVPGYGSGVWYGVLAPRAARLHLTQKVRGGGRAMSSLRYGRHPVVR